MPCILCQNCCADHFPQEAAQWRVLTLTLLPSGDLWGSGTLEGGSIPSLWSVIWVDTSLSFLG